MTNYLAALAALLILAAAGSPNPGAPAPAFSPPRVAAVPGGVVTFRIPGAPDARPAVDFAGHPVLVVRQKDAWLAVLGIGLELEIGRAHV